MKRIWRKIKNRFGHSRDRQARSRSFEEYMYDSDDDEEFLEAHQRALADYYHLHSLLARLDRDVIAEIQLQSRMAKSPLPPALEETKPEEGEKGRSISDISAEEEMMKELTCPVCDHIYIDPVMSPCLHSLCSACAHTLVSTDDKGECPVCKEEITLNEMKKNYPLKGIVEAFSRRMNKSDEKTKTMTQETKTKEHIDESHVMEGEKLNTASSIPQTRQCSLCDDSPDWYCIQCEMKLCVKCLNGFHPTLESTPDHTLISLNAETAVIMSNPL